ncbi:MAG: AmmeMemoRadiSam system radical SAM enzyme [Candidatus Marinimicrobia bacterium CG_4_10_14_0_2_um_filter_48_9]|nr:MAG: AmmeMemoRadiSam system radical SAM enzyme [Candidatus Marinimicrobia bacterium CG_4_10_14_0_2_um_filter_48_9]
MALAPIQTATKWWHTTTDNQHVVCTLCPRFCRLKPGQAGFCFVRENQNGVLVSKAYGQPLALNIDPIEKKPLFHFYPASRILSIGTAGCNMGCKFCQNWDISHATENHQYSRHFTPEALVQMAQKQSIPSIAFTYNEPTIFGEYVMDISQLAHKQNIHTVMVTNGFITDEAIQDIYPLIDAANIDLKAFSDNFYRKITLSKISPVLDAIVKIRSLGTWVELTTLLIPGLNTGENEIRELATWVLHNLGCDTPLHFSAFHPDYKLRNIPATSINQLERAYAIAREVGLNHVYLGNIVTEKGNTLCPNCQSAVIRRSWYDTNNMLSADGCCPTCGTQLPGVYNQVSPVN